MSLKPFPVCVLYMCSWCINSRKIEWILDLHNQQVTRWISWNTLHKVILVSWFLQFMKRILNQILIPMKFELSFLKQNKTEQNKTCSLVALSKQHAWEDFWNTHGQRYHWTFLNMLVVMRWTDVLLRHGNSWSILGKSDQSVCLLKQVAPTQHWILWNAFTISIWISFCLFSFISNKIFV